MKNNSTKLILSIIVLCSMSSLKCPLPGAEMKSRSEKPALPPLPSYEIIFDATSSEHPVDLIVSPEGTSGRSPNELRFTDIFKGHGDQNSALGARVDLKIPKNKIAQLAKENKDVYLMLMSNGKYMYTLVIPNLYFKELSRFMIINDHVVEVDFR